MKKTYFTSGGRLRQLGLTALLAGGAALAGSQKGYAQTLNYTVTGATNVAGTYTELNTSTGTAIATANTDDANSAAQNIGFTFNYNGTAFTQFTLSTNGFIKLGATAPSATNLYLPESATSTAVDPFQSSNDPNLIAPFNFDLAAGSAGGTEYRFYTSGNLGSRVCTIQWKNVADKSGTYLNQYDNFSFQAKLYEGTGVIEFVYSSATAGANPDDFRFAGVGLKGTSFASGQIVQVLKQSTAPWSGATFGNYATAVANNAPNTLNFRKTVLPDAGRTFRFTPVTANDASVAAIYTYGKLATPAATPNSVQAVITNVGSAARTNLVVTLAVTGANTFNDTQTIASLAAGASATVTFASYPATLAVGTNTVSVTIPNDDNNANNSATTPQLVSATTLSYINPSGTFNTAGVGVGQAGAALAVKYTLPSARTLTGVTLTFAASTGNTSTYQVLLYDATGTGGTPGTLLYTSATQTRTAAAGTNTVTLANQQVPATFYVGVKELATNPALAYQIEDPLRPNTYYYSLNASTSWVSVNTTTLRPRLAIDLTFGASVTATSPALQRAISVYPNPSASGIFTLDVKGANAGTGLGVEVTDQLGRRVHTGSVRDNFTNTLDLSSLAPGIYHLTVRNGSEYVSTKLSIVQ